MNQTRQRTDAEFELVDLADYPLPHLDGPLPANMGQYQNPHTQDWAARHRPVRRIHLRHRDAGCLHFGPVDLMTFDVTDQIELIDKPQLMIAGSQADTRYMTEEAFPKATGTEDKELFLIDGARHIETY